MQDFAKSAFDRKSMGLILGLTAVFFAVFTFALRGFVPAQSAEWQLLLGACTASCLTGVFFIAACMLRAIIADMRQQPKGKDA